MQLFLACALFGLAGAAELPSCEADTEANCLGEDADLSSAGITACLKALGDQQSDRCKAYFALVDGCATDIGAGGICESAHRDGETVPCLLQRVKPEDLSESCVAAMPAKEEAAGLAGKFWADGKRFLEDDEVAELNEDDKDTYNRWVKKKKGKKTSRDKDKAYAVKKQKKEMADKRVNDFALAEASKVLGTGVSKKDAVAEVVKAVTAEAAQVVKEDMTKTLKAYTKKEIQVIAKDAVSKAKPTKTEL